MGSGVIIGSDDSQLYIVTNYHVAEGATQLSVTFADDQTYAAQLLGYDSSVDIALLGVPLNSITSDTLSQISIATIGDSVDLMTGEQVVAIGNGSGVWPVSDHRTSRPGSNHQFGQRHHSLYPD